MPPNLTHEAESFLSVLFAAFLSFHNGGWWGKYSGSHWEALNLLAPVLWCIHVFFCLGPFDSQHSTRLKLRWYIIQFFYFTSTSTGCWAAGHYFEVFLSGHVLVFWGQCLLHEAFWHLLNLHRRHLRHLLGDTLSPQVPLPASTVQPRMLRLSHPHQTPKGAPSGWCSFVIVHTCNLAQPLFFHVPALLFLLRLAPWRYFSSHYLTYSASSPLHSFLSRNII